MKKLFFFIITSFCSLNIFGQWTQLNPGTSQGLNAIYFLNSDTGFIGGSAGITSTTLLKTTDGGISWSSPNITTVNSIRSIYFTNSQIGFLTTSSASESFRTIDGGANWTSINTAIYNAGDVYFKDLDTGFAYSPNNGNDVSYTFDGGTTWTHYPNGTFGGAGISSIHFPLSNSSIGFAVSAWGGNIFKTTNGGISWTQISQPTSQDLNDVFFTSTNNGYIIGSNFILETLDGGTNWTTTNSNLGGKKIKVINSDIYLLNSDSIRISTNNGASFIAMTGTINGLNNLHILSSTSGYCVGGSGRIFKLGSTTAINESYFTLNHLKVFPNPASTHIFIEYGNYSGMNGCELKIVNSIGQTVLTNPINQQTSYIDLSTWSSKGIYYVQLMDPEKNTIECRKIIIQ